MKTLIFISLNMPILLINSFHPTFILILIIFQTLILCMIMWKFLKTSWLSFILFLIFLGGMMILFLYIVSLASNEMFKFIKTTNLLINFSMMSMFILITMNMMSSPLMNNIMTVNKKIISSMMSSQTLFLTLLIMLYLLFTLIIVVKMTSKNEGPVRNCLN